MKDDDLFRELSATAWHYKDKKSELIRPLDYINKQLDNYIEQYNLKPFVQELDYHFNRGEWVVDLANTKKTMINYDFRDLISGITANSRKEDDETNKSFQQRARDETDRLRSNLLDLHQEFRTYVFEKIKPMVMKMDYDDLFTLFQDTWGNAPFKLNYLLEDMFILMGDKSIMQNVVGNSGSFKSTRTMIECNTLPSVLLVDDATIAGISRDSQTKGTEYLNNTVVYYNDVGDSSQMQANFQQCLESIYKKLFSEGAINRNIAMKNSDQTLRLHLKTPDGFKLKFNSVKSIFSEDDGQTASRMMTINLPSFTPEEAIELIRSGRFGKAVKTKIDPRIFKDVFYAYYHTREEVIFDPEFLVTLGIRCIEDNNGVSNWHGIANNTYQHEEMFKLYGKKLYKEKYYNRVMINTSVSDMEQQLYDIIKDTLVVRTWPVKDIKTHPDVNLFTVAKSRTASAHTAEREYDSFTVKAVRGIRRKFVKNNETKIPGLLRSMEEHDLCTKVGMLGTYNIYVLLDM